MSAHLESGTDWYFILVLAFGVLLQWRYTSKVKRRRAEHTDTSHEQERARALVTQLKKNKQKRPVPTPTLKAPQISPGQTDLFDVNLNTTQAAKENKSVYLNNQHTPAYNTETLREFMKMQAILGPPVSMRGDVYAED